MIFKISNDLVAKLPGIAKNPDTLEERILAMRYMSTKVLETLAKTHGYQYAPAFHSFSPMLDGEDVYMRIGDYFFSDRYVYATERNKFISEIQKALKDVGLLPASSAVDVHIIKDRAIEDFQDFIYEIDEGDPEGCEGDIYCNDYVSRLNPLQVHNKGKVFFKVETEFEMNFSAILTTVLIASGRASRSDAVRSFAENLNCSDEEMKELLNTFGVDDSPAKTLDLSQFENDDEVMADCLAFAEHKGQEFEYDLYNAFEFFDSIKFYPGFSVASDRRDRGQIKVRTLDVVSVPESLKNFAVNLIRGVYKNIQRKLFDDGPCIIRNTLVTESDIVPENPYDFRERILDEKDLYHANDIDIHSDPEDYSNAYAVTVGVDLNLDGDMRDSNFVETAYDKVRRVFSAFEEEFEDRLDNFEEYDISPDIMDIQYTHGYKELTYDRKNGKPAALIIFFTEAIDGFPIEKVEELMKPVIREISKALGKDPELGLIRFLKVYHITADNAVREEALDFFAR